LTNPIKAAVKEGGAHIVHPSILVCTQNPVELFRLIQFLESRI
jgi:hypothetical protein